MTTFGPEALKIDEATETQRDVDTDPRLYAPGQAQGGDRRSLRRYRFQCGRGAACARSAPSGSLRFRCRSRNPPTRRSASAAS